jgi:N-acetylmuramic acid 6-phosphate etherase
VTPSSDDRHRDDAAAAAAPAAGPAAAPDDTAAPATERVDPAFADLDAWPLARSLEALADGQTRAVDAVRRALPQLEKAAAGVEARLAAGGRLVYAGAGTSGRLAVQDAAELPPTFGFERTLVLMAGGAEAGASAREGAEDDEADARARVAAAGLGAADAFVGVAASGRTPFTVAALRAARAAGAFTIGIANVEGTPLLDAAEAPIWLDTGPEVLAGSTRLAAGTAQKAALNLISTAVLVRLGGAYGNLMVGMRPLNAKLRRRAAAMVARAAGVDEARATEALASADGDVRVAVVVAKAGVGAARARAALEANGLRVRAAVAALAAAAR